MTLCYTKHSARSPDVGPAYQFLDEKMGKTLKNVATHDLLSCVTWTEKNLNRARQKGAF